MLKDRFVKTQVSDETTLYDSGYHRSQTTFWNNVLLLCNTFTFMGPNFTDGLWVYDADTSPFPQKKRIVVKSHVQKRTGAEGAYDLKLGVTVKTRHTRGTMFAFTNILFLCKTCTFIAPNFYLWNDVDNRPSIAVEEHLQQRKKKRCSQVARPGTKGRRRRLCRWI